jgi:predicted transcriptional regulator
MKTTMKPLYAMTAADLMSNSIVLIPSEMSISCAARMLSQAEVSGAPIVDHRGHCVGVISATDFVHLAENSQPRTAAKVKDPKEMCQPWEIPDQEQQEENTVGKLMSHDPVLVAPSTNIGDLARMMIDAHIHRVIVVDAERKPMGIVATTDILAAVARDYQRTALEEQQPTTGPINLPKPVEMSSSYSIG